LGENTGVEREEGGSAIFHVESKQVPGGVVQWGELKIERSRTNSGRVPTVSPYTQKYQGPDNTRSKAKISSRGGARRGMKGARGPRITGGERRRIDNRPSSTNTAGERSKRSRGSDIMITLEGRIDQEKKIKKKLWDVRVKNV